MNDERLRAIRDTRASVSKTVKALAYDQDVDYLLEEVERLRSFLRTHEVDVERLKALTGLEEALRRAGYHHGPCGPTG